MAPWPSTSTRCRCSGGCAPQCLRCAVTPSCTAACCRRTPSGARASCPHRRPPTRPAARVIALEQRRPTPCRRAAERSAAFSPPLARRAVPSDATHPFRIRCALRARSHYAQVDVRVHEPASSPRRASRPRVGSHAVPETASLARRARLPAPSAVLGIVPKVGAHLMMVARAERPWLGPLGFAGHAPNAAAAQTLLVAPTTGATMTRVATEIDAAPSPIVVLTWSLTFLAAGIDLGPCVELGPCVTRSLGSSRARERKQRDREERQGAHDGNASPQS